MPAHRNKGFAGFYLFFKLFIGRRTITAERREATRCSFANPLGTSRRSPQMRRDLPASLDEGSN